jgi:hypothetical protein
MATDEPTARPIRTANLPSASSARRGALAQPPARTSCRAKSATSRPRASSWWPPAPCPMMSARAISRKSPCKPQLGRGNLDRHRALARLPPLAPSHRLRHPARRSKRRRGGAPVPGAAPSREKALAPKTNRAPSRQRLTLDWVGTCPRYFLISISSMSKTSMPNGRPGGPGSSP